MKKINSKIMMLTFVLTMLLTMMSTTVFAAWWGTPGYEWAREKKLTSLSNNSALNNKVSLENFYSILINYLKYKNVVPKNSVIQHNSSNNFNKALDGIVGEINSYLDKESLSPKEYRNVAGYAEHIRKTVNTNSNLLTRDNVKTMDLYLSLVKYSAAVKISEDSYKSYVLKNMGAVKYKELVTYHVKPYFGDISRKEFLTLMFSLLSDRTLSEEDMINEFKEAGVLLGFDTEGQELGLAKNLTYAEMFTFLRRFETFEFNPTESGDTNGSEVVEVQ